MNARRRKVVVAGSIATAALCVIMLLGCAFAAAIGDTNSAVRGIDPTATARAHGNMWLINNAEDLIDKATGAKVFDHENPQAPERLAEAVAVLNPEVQNESKPSTSIGPTAGNGSC